MVHARNVGAHELTFKVSGKLWRNSLVMQDNQTETLRCHITGGVRAFRAAVDGQLLTFEPAGQPDHRYDQQTGSSWDLTTGLACDGP